MILAVDIGNTTIGIGVFSGDRLCLYEKISSQETLTILEYIEKLKNIFSAHKLSPEEFDGSILSCVVPRLTEVFLHTLEQYTGKQVLLLSHKMNLGYELKVDYPEQVGSDRLADAAGAVGSYPLPLITIDMGTATTINVIDENLLFRGGIILPGVGTAHEALLGKAAQLFHSQTHVPGHTIGTNTQECITSGMIYGNACAIDGIISRIQKELGQPCTIVATGGYSEQIIPHCKSEIIIDNNLLIKGLIRLYETNK